VRKGVRRRRETHTIKKWVYRASSYLFIMSVNNNRKSVSQKAGEKTTRAKRERSKAPRAASSFYLSIFTAITRERRWRRRGNEGREGREGRKVEEGGGPPSLTVTTTTTIYYFHHNNTNNQKHA